MTNTFEWLSKQIETAATEYFDQDLESFFLPKEGDKTLEELIQSATGFDTKRVSSYAYGSMVELELSQHNDKKKRVMASKFKIAVKAVINNGVREKIEIIFGY